MSNDRSRQGEIRLSDEASKLATPTELPARDKAVLEIAKRVLGGAFVLALIAVLVVIGAPADRLAEANQVLEVVKTVVPPIVTLVLGFYFRAESN